MQRSLTEEERQLLQEMAEDTFRGKEARRTKGKGDIAKHYREQLDQMKALRECGATGRLEFEDYF